MFYLSIVNVDQRALISFGKGVENAINSFSVDKGDTIRYRRATIKRIGR